MTLYEATRRGSAMTWMRFGAALVLALGAAAARADDWPQWLGPKGDAEWRETGLLDKFPKDGPKVLWRKELGAGYAGPAVVGDRVFVTDRVRPREGEKPERGVLPGGERVLCLDAASGKIVWEHKYDCPYVRISFPSGPRTTPVIRGDRLWTLGTMGDLLCLEAKTGKVVWEKKLPKEYEIKPPVWGWSASLLLDDQRLYSLVGGKGSAVCAFDAATGKELWRALDSEEVCYAPPTIVEAGGKRQLIVWLSDSVNGLDPETGKVHWTEAYPENGKPMRPAVSISTPVVLDGGLYVTSFYHGGLMLELDRKRPTATVRWRGKSDNIEKPDGLHALMMTPLLFDGHIYGVCGMGELRCLDAKTGKELWQTYAATGGKRDAFATAFLVRQGDRCWLFNDQGELILAKLSPKGYEELSRAKILEPSQDARGRTVVWSHPAFANRCVFARNDKEIVCVSVAK
jgi:outer membrane protein assembly factor BamB